MAGFKDIIGHEQIIEHLQNAIGMDKVSHAYIINGPDKSGKMKHLQWLCSVKSMEKRHVWSAIPANRRWDTISRILFM